MGNYNTIYANFQRTGFARIDLNRSWENTGDAVTITIPPEVRLIVNNINLENVIVGPLLEDEDGSQINNSSGVGIQYFISLNDGVSYEEVNVGELAYILDQDYRLKLKITLTKIGENSQTPIIEGFTVAYAAYQTEEQTTDPSLQMTTSASSFTIAQNFTLTLRVVDPLGFVIPSYSGVVNLQLQNFADNSPAAGFSHATVNVVNGIASITNANISQTGVYRIIGSNADVSAFTGQLTVTNPPASQPTPTMSFYASSYSILPGEEVTLYWSTTHLSSVTLSSVGAVAASGSLAVSPEETITYVLSGISEGGNSLSAGLTITVLGIGDDGEQEGAGELSLTVDPEVITVMRGGRVQISWVALNADDVFIDYTNSTGSPVGSFEFFPEEDVVITITARRGDESVSKQIHVFVIEEEFTSGSNILGTSTPTTPGIVALATIFVVAVLNGGLANYAAIFFGLLIWRKRKYWGVVFDADTFEPLALVTVRIYLKNAASRTFVAQTVTDLEGRYGINVAEVGSYTVEFVREGYASLLKEITINRNQDVMLDVGMRESNEIEGGFGGLRYFWKQNAASIMQILRVVVITLMGWGLSLSLSAIAQDAGFANYLVAGLYLIVLVLQIAILLEPYFGRKTGAVVDTGTKRPITGAVLRLLNIEENGQNVENVGITNTAGIVKLRVQQGSYQYMASRNGYATSQGTIGINASGKLTKLIYLDKASTDGASAKFAT